MRLGPIRDLIAHAGAELKATAVAELRLERALETEENVSLLAPMIGAVARRVLDHADANRTEVASARAGSAGFAGTLAWGDGGPIGGAEREVADLQSDLSSMPVRPPPNLRRPSTSRAYHCSKMSRAILARRPGGEQKARR